MKKLCCILMVLLLMMGCGVQLPETEPQAVSLVLGHHACFPQVSDVWYEDQVYAAVASYGQISAVVSDGQPELAMLVENQKPEKTIDRAKHEQLTRTAVQTVLTQLSAVSATEPETDLLGSIHVAVNSLRAGGLTQKTLVIVDSGLSTAGLLNFTASNLLDADPDDVVQALQACSSLPDLSGIDVVFLGLGQTAAPQTRPDAQTQASLQDLWSAVLQAGMPKSLTFDPMPLSGSAGQALPLCSTVELISEQLPLEADDPIGEEPVRLSSVRFVSDSSDFLDRNGAVEVLLPIGQYLAAHPEVQICLAGMTASAGGSGEALSLQRAEACKALLLELGASDNQIQCLGLGRRENFLRVQDLDANGNLIEEAAEKNRAVFLFSIDSETAKKLLYDYMDE